MGVHEVTRGEFRAFVSATNYQTTAEKDPAGGQGIADGVRKWNPRFNWKAELGYSREQTDKHPVVNVSWDDAAAFCVWLSEKEGHTYRLPTEAEWEYACRAGTTTKWSFCDQLRLMEKFARYGRPFREGPAPIGEMQPNGFGLFDMHGNVSEWCRDAYKEGYYRESPPQDPEGPPYEKLRMYRGGNYIHSGPISGQSASRHNSRPSLASMTIGFRVVRELK